MIKYFSVFSILFLVSFNCNKAETKICNTSAPLEDLAWLKEIKYSFDMDTSQCRQKILLYQYNSNYVFLIDRCSSAADHLSQVYNCEGKVICEFGGIAGINTCPDFEQKAVMISSLYDL